MRLADAGYDIVGVLTQPDRPIGRGLVVGTSAVKQLALKNKWLIHQPPSLKNDSALDEIMLTRADVLVVAAYGKILPTKLLQAFRLGAINVHASLLPRWRGAAPINRAIAAGDSETGISIMKMTEGLDEGPVYRQDCLLINPDETATELEDRLSLLGGESLLHVLNLLPQLAATPQKTEGISYANKITTTDGAIDVNAPAEKIYRKIRAFTTTPGCYLTRGEEHLRIGAAHWPIFESFPKGNPGDIVGINNEGVLLQCADGAIRLIALQRPGRRMMSAVHVINGLRLSVGQSLIFPQASRPATPDPFLIP